MLAVGRDGSTYSCDSRKINRYDNQMSGNMLLIGGSSSLSPAIFNSAMERGFSVTATSRSEREVTSAKVRWEQMDLSDLSSVMRFIDSLSPRSIDLVIFAAGEPSPSGTGSWGTYAETHLANTVFFLIRSWGSSKVTG